MLTITLLFSVDIFRASMEFAEAKVDKEDTKNNGRGIFFYFFGFIFL